MSGNSQVPSNSGLSQILSQDEIDEKAWKYTGYPGFARFVASDPDFFVVRRFDKLNARVLLTLQDHLSLLEERLEALDSAYSTRSAGDVNNGSVRHDRPDRAALLAQISSKLQEYNTLLLAHSELRSRASAPGRNITNVENWFYNNEGAIMEEERRFVMHKEDLLSISKSEKATMRQFLENHIIFRLHWLWKKDPPPETRDVDKEIRIYGSDEKIDIITTTVILVIGLGMLVAPIWILAAVTNAYSKLGVITAFIVIFLSTVSYATVTKPAETLAATAAYSAVMMVFLQLGNAK